MNSGSLPMRPRRPRPLSYEDLRRFLFLVLGLGLAGLVIHAVSKILILFTIVLFAAMVLNPVVSWLTKRGFKRPIATLVVLLSLLGGLVGVGFLVVPPLVEQVSELVAGAPTYSENIENQLKAVLDRFPQLKNVLPAEYRGAGLDRLGETLGKQAGPQVLEWLQNLGPNIGNRVLKLTLSFVGGFFSIVIALLLTAFVLSNPRPLVTGFLAAVPDRHREAAGRSIARIENQMVAWMRATLINGVITGVSTGLLLYFIGLPSAIVFGVLSFLGEFVPNLGPIVTSIPALFVAAGLGTTKFALTAAAILFVQQVESNILVPFIMGKEMELHPVTIVFFALAMGSLFGVAGAVLAVPLAAIVKVLVDEFVFKPNAVPMQEIEARAQKLVSDRQWPARQED